MKLKDASALGKTIKCPKCAKTFVASAQPVAAAAGAPTKKKRPPADEGPPDDDADDEEAGEQPKKNKKKKKKKKASSGVPLPLILGIAGFVFLFVVGGVVLLIVANKGGGGSRAAAVPVPELLKFEMPSFSMPAPKGWTKEDGGSENHHWVEFTSGPIKIRAQDDSAGVGDIIAGPNRGEKMDDHRMEVIHGVHLGKKEVVAEDYNNYQEDEPVPFNAPLPGMGRWSPFSGSVSSMIVFKTKIRGIRATVQSNTKTIILRCTCPESQWESFKPIFEQIVTGIGPGRRI